MTVQKIDEWMKCSIYYDDEKKQILYCDENGKVVYRVTLDDEVIIEEEKDLFSEKT